MSEQLLGIKEVQEGGKRIANHYLGHGYLLLEIQAGAQARRFPGQSVGGSQYYVRRNPIYVLGRPEGVEAAPAPARWTRPEESGGQQQQGQTS